MTLLDDDWAPREATGATGLVSAVLLEFVELLAAPLIAPRELAIASAGRSPTPREAERAASSS